MLSILTSLLFLFLYLFLYLSHFSYTHLRSSLCPNPIKLSIYTLFHTPTLAIQYQLASTEHDGQRYAEDRSTRDTHAASPISYSSATQHTQHVRSTTTTAAATATTTTTAEHIQHPAAATATAGSDSCPYQSTEHR